MAQEAARKAKEKEKEAAAKAEAAPNAAEMPSPEEAEFEQARVVAMKFLGGAVNAIKATHPQLDAYNKFGVNLFLAGACSALAKARGLSDRYLAALVRECVEVIGTRPEQARQLVSRLPAYRNEARYRQMIGAGFTAMEVSTSGASDPFIAMGGIMKDWNTPQSQQISAASVTLMFTDMVGSTDITQAIGDMAAQDIIRAHNHIVRLALSHHGGREVKHTGDGIMASFDAPLDAVRASIDIQRRAAEHTARWPRLPLILRIGMNTGEPIIEENDYFGATVQIAARVCAMAGPGEIWLAEESRRLIPASGGIELADHGLHSLKGVKEDVRLFEAVWNDDQREALRAAGTPTTAPTPDDDPAAEAVPAPPEGAPPEDAKPVDASAEGAAPAEAPAATPAKSASPATS